MKKLLSTFALVMIAATFVNAQGSDHNKGEFFVGFSHGQVDGSTFIFPRTSNQIGESGPHKFNGFNASGVYNISRYIGLKGDVSGTYHGGDFLYPLGPNTAITGNVRNSLYNFLGGVQFKDNAATRRVKPFGHVMVGAGLADIRVKDATCTPPAGCGGVILPASNQETGLAGVIGGGFDLKLNDRFDLRLVQIDYNPVNLESGMLHNARIGIGIVIK